MSSSKDKLEKRLQRIKADTDTGEYNPVTMLGEGRYSFVVGAENRSGDMYALKIPKKPDYNDIFIRIAKNMQPIRGLHQAIIDIVDTVGPILVMPVAKGKTLKETKKEHGPLPIESSLYVGSQVLEALDKLHAHDMFHLDIRPSNISIEYNPGSKRVDSVSLFDIGHLEMMLGLGVMSRDQNGPKRYYFADKKSDEGFGHFAPEKLLSNEISPGVYSDIYMAMLMMKWLMFSDTIFKTADISQAIANGFAEDNLPNVIPALNKGLQILDQNQWDNAKSLNPVPYLNAKEANLAVSGLLYSDANTLDTLMAQYEDLKKGKRIYGVLTNLQEVYRVLDDVQGLNLSGAPEQRRSDLLEDAVNMLAGEVRAVLSVVNEKKGKTFGDNHIKKLGYLQKYFKELQTPESLKSITERAQTVGGVYDQ